MRTCLTVPSSLYHSSSLYHPSPYTIPQDLGYGDEGSPPKVMQPTACSPLLPCTAAPPPLSHLPHSTNTGLHNPLSPPPKDTWWRHPGLRYGDHKGKPLSLSLPISLPLFMTPLSL